MSAGALIGTDGFALVLVAVVVLQRIVPGHAALVATGTAVALYFAVPLAALRSGAAFNFWEYTAVYSCLTLAFLMVFGALYKSVSLRMLEFLLAQPGRAAPAQTVARECVSAASFAHRLEVIERARLATPAPEGFALTQRGRALARVVRALHALFAIERIG